MNIELGVLELSVVIIASLTGGFLKGVTGMGLPLILTPPLAWVFGIHIAVPLVAIPTVITNMVFVGKFRHAWREVIKIWPMVLAGLVAIAGGVLFLQYSDQSTMAIILSLLAISYVLLNFFGYELRVSSKHLNIFGPVMGVMAGFFHGTTGVSAPPVVAYLNSIKDLTRGAYFQALGLIFFIFGLNQVTGYVISGLYNEEIITIGLMATIPVLGSFFVGNWLQSRLDAQKFKRATLLLIFLSSVNLLINNI